MPNVTISINAAYPGAPEGILGGYIQDRLAAYVEPTRTGTPRGEVIGFSRKKYHAVLLAMTNLPLKKQAKLIDVGSGVLKTWRAERPFLERLVECIREFLREIVPNAGAIGLLPLKSNPVSIKDNEKDILEDDLVSLGGPLGLGFEDSHLYNFRLSEMVVSVGIAELDIAAEECRRLLESGNDVVTEIVKQVEQPLKWALPMTRVLWSYPEPSRSKELLALAGLLVGLQAWLFHAWTDGPQDKVLMQQVGLITKILDSVVTVTPELSKQIRRRTSQALTNAVVRKP